MTCEHTDVTPTGFRNGHQLGRCRGCRIPMRQVATISYSWEVVA